MTTSDLPGFPFDTPPEFDGEPEYARLRVADPVPKVRLPAGGEAYLATRYADVKRVFADPVFSRAEASKPGAQVLRPNHRGSPHLLVSMDPPEHSRVRKLVMRALTVRAVDRMRPRVQQTVDSLIDRMVEQGPPSDFVKA